MVENTANQMIQGDSFGFCWITCALAAPVVQLSVSFFWFLCGWLCVMQALHNSFYLFGKGRKQGRKLVLKKRRKDTSVWYVVFALEDAGFG